MMGTPPNRRQPALFSCHIDLEDRLGAGHLLRKVAATLDLSFVIPTVRHRYGRSGNVSLDSRVIVKLLLLLFLYDIPSERELMEQIRARLDFLWFLGFDLETDIPNHSVLSPARARWGTPGFEQLFVQTVHQCVQAGLVNGRLLQVDSTMVKANAHKDSVVPSGPELVGALRQAYQEQAAKLPVLPADPKESAATGAALTPAPEPASALPSVTPLVPAVAPAPVPVAPTPAVENTPREPSQRAATPAEAPSTALPAEPSAAVVAPVALKSPAAPPPAPPRPKPARQPRVPLPQRRPAGGCCPRPRRTSGPTGAQRSLTPSRRRSRFRPTARAGAPPTRKPNWRGARTDSSI